jgi:hypothetical protein
VTRAEEIAHARAVDTEVARLYGLYHDIADQIKKLRDSIERDQASKGQRWNQAPEAQAKLDAAIARKEAQILDLQPEAKARMDAAWGYDADNYGGWNRFFLVQHIHSSMHCSSFRPTTRVGWLPDVSGLTEAEAVAAHGETLCTKCYPDAPVALTVKPADPSACAGTGTYIQRADTAGGRGYYADCPVCGKQVSRVQGSGKLRKHKAA